MEQPWYAEWIINGELPDNTLAIDEHYLNVARQCLSHDGVSLVPVLGSPHVPYVFAIGDAKPSKSIAEMCMDIVDASPSILYPAYAQPSE